MYYCALYLGGGGGTLEHSPQNVCLLCNLVRFGLHFLRTFSEANIYEYLSSICFANFSACRRPFLCLWGAFFGSPPPRTKLSACAYEYMMVLLRTIDKGMEAYAPPPQKLL